MQGDTLDDSDTTPPIPPRSSSGAPQKPPIRAGSEGIRSAESSADPAARSGTWGMLESLTRGLEREALDSPFDPKTPRDDCGELAQHALECLGSFCRATRGSLYLREPEGGLSLAASTPTDSELPTQLPPPSAPLSPESPTLMARVLRTGSPLFLDDVGRFRQKLGLEPPKHAHRRRDPSCIVLPLASSPNADPTEAAGVLNFSDLRTPPPGEGSVRRHALLHGAQLVALGMRLRASIVELEARASRDGLTHLFNYKTFYETLGREVFRAERYRSQLSLILFDIDSFKLINDRYGHLAGDAILAELAERLRDALRNADVAARYAGDEFAVILPETDLAGAVRVAERVRSAVAEASFAYLQTPIEVTISLGVSELGTGMTAVDLVNSADRQLYQAKDLGRNRVAADR